jgi:hypothetical protein
MTPARAFAVVVVPLLAAAGTSGCAASRLTLERIPPPCTFSVSGDRLLCDGAPHAQLVGRHCRTRGDWNRVEDVVKPGQSQSCRGLGVLYADGSRVTLYRADSLGDLWAPAGAYATSSKSEFIAGWASDIDVDVVNRRVTFGNGTMLTTSRWAYDVGTGSLVELD